MRLSSFRTASQSPLWTPIRQAAVTYGISHSLVIITAEFSQHAACGL